MGCSGMEFSEKNRLAFLGFMADTGCSDKKEALALLVEKITPSCFGDGMSKRNCMECNYYEFCDKLKALPKVKCPNCAYLDKEIGTCGVSFTMCNSDNGFDRFISKGR